MRRLAIYLLAALMALPAASYAQKANSDILKFYKKEIKEKKKEYEAGGWQLFGTSRSIDVALAKFFEKLDNMGSDGQEIVGNAPRFSSKNTGHQMAFASAANQLAQQNSGTVKGVLESNLGSDGHDVSKEIDSFMAAFTRKVEFSIKGQLEEAYSLIREIEPGVYEMQSFYVYNKKSLSEARIRAIRSTALENEITRELAEKLEEAAR